MAETFTVEIRDPQGRVSTRQFKLRSVKIGRAGQNDVVLDGPMVSDHHAILFVRSGRFIITDLGSSHGTLRGGQRLTRPAALSSGEEITLGGFALKCEAPPVGQPEERAPAPEAAGVQDLLARLRDHLYGEKTQEAWAEVCAMLDAWPQERDLQLGLDYCGPLMESWPDRLRSAPDIWKEALLKGRRNPRFSIVRRLDLSYHFLGPSGAVALARRPWLASLRILALRTAYLGDEGVRALTVGSNCLRQLRSLDLSHNAISDTGARMISTCSALEGLETLILDANPIEGPGVLALGSSAFLAGLKALDLSNTAGGPQLATAMVSAEGFSGLESLHLGGNDIGADGAQMLTHAPCMATLRSLAMEKNKVGDEGVIALTRGRDRTRIERLDLSMNQVGDAGAVAIAHCGNFPALTHLDLSQNRLSPKGIEALASSAHLKRLTSLKV